MERRAPRQRTRRYQDFVRCLSRLRAEAYELGLPHVHNHVARSVSDAPFEIRSKDLGTTKRLKRIRSSAKDGPDADRELSIEMLYRDEWVPRQHPILRHIETDGRLDRRKANFVIATLLD